MSIEIEPVTKDSIDAIINDSTANYTHEQNKLTHVTVTLPCGFILTGESFCADPNIFDESKGEEYSLDKAREKLWELENYCYSKAVMRKKTES